MLANLHLRGGCMLDPVTGREETADLLILNGQLVAPPAASLPGVEVLDVGGMLVVPGLMDLHVHLREPGGEEAETIATGSRAAARGGFTRILAMPNTRPPLDSPARVAEVRAAGDRAGGADVMTTACITRDRRGETLADLPALAAAGAAAFTDDGCTVQDDALMESAMRAARELDLPILDHAQDLLMERQGGVMHEGAASARHGLPGIPSRAESRIIERDIALAARTGCRLHIQHVSTAEGVALLRAAMARGLRVSGEATPHHLLFTEEDVDPSDADFKMNPPLRTHSDRDALRAAIADGTLAALATDHAPHSAARKAEGFLRAPFGVIGLETAVGVTYTLLVRELGLPRMTWLKRWTTGPAQVLGMRPPGLATGAPADLTVLDVDTPWQVEPSAFLSRSRNTPFKGRRLQGRAVLTVADGRITWRDERRVAR